MTMPDQTMAGLVAAHASRAAMAARLAELSDRPVDVLYFGCIERAGHYLWSREGTGRPCTDRRDRELAQRLGGLDGALCWNSKSKRGQYSHERDETEGLAFLTHREGWTALAFWDRSVDHRGACNSAFLAEGTLTFAQIIRHARLRWPEVWARFSFEIVEVDAGGRRR